MSSLSAPSLVEPPRTLDEAWVEAEAALPKGHILAELKHFHDGWSAATDNTTEVGRYHYSGDGPTPIAALRALAAKLREVQADQ